MQMGRMAARWGDLSLSQRFAATGGFVMLLAMAGIGWWVGERIERNVIDNTATATALYMDSFIAPLAQELDTADTLSIGPVRAIEEMLSGSALGQRIVAVKIWKPGGLVAYSDEPEIVGTSFPVTDGLKAAFAGSVVAEFNELEDDENALERARNLPLLEIYSPIRQAFSGRILGVVEFYENAATLQETLDRTRLQSWAIVALTTLAIGAALFGIVLRGSRLIERQKDELRTQLAEIRTISAQNDGLRRRVERAARQVSEANERTLRRISAELHDGPKQLIGFAAMRIDSLAAGAPEGRTRDFAVVSDALGDALREISNLCGDLALPEIDGMPVDEILRKVAAAHGFRTGTEVALDLQVDPAVPVSQAVRLCAYRFAQESLNNAWRHAGGHGQSLTCRQNGSDMRIVVANGPGPSIPGDADPAGGLGLSGLRGRIESLGGSFAFRRTAAGGAVAEMRIDTASYEDTHA
jgi:signal transduction histidine kinase